MQRIIKLIAAKPWPFLAVIALGSLLAAWQARKVTINVGADGMMITGDPDRPFYTKTLQDFGSDNMEVVFIQDKELFKRDKLEAIREVTEVLAEIKGVSKVDSLFTMQNFKDVEGSLNTSPFLEDIPEDPADIERVRKDALANPLIARNAISDDGTSIAVNVYLRNEDNEEKFDDRVTAEIETAVAPLKGKFEKVFQVGMPYTRQTLATRLLGDQKILTPLAAVAFLLSILMCTGSLRTASVPLCTSGLSILWTLGFMGWIGIPVTILTSIVPVLLIISGSGEDSHMIMEFEQGLAEGMDKKAALHYMASKLGLALFIAFFASYLGYLSVSTYDIKMVKQFGIVASTGLFLNFFISMIVTTCYLLFFGKKPAHMVKEGESKFDKASAKVVKVFDRHRKAAVITIACAVVLAAAGTFRVRVDNNILSYFKKSSEVRQRTDMVSHRLSGSQTFYIVLTSKQEDAFRDPHFLSQIVSLQEHIKGMKIFDASYSIADYLALINREMNGGDPRLYKMPETKEMVAQYLMLLRQPDIDKYVTSDFAKANILVRHNVYASRDLNRALDQIRGYFKELDPRLDVRITGEAILTNKAADSMAGNEASSLLQVVTVFFLIMSLVFWNMKAGALSLIPNLIPISVLFGVMGYFDIPIDVGTIMIANIVLGIAMDDTTHFMIRFNEEMRETANEKLAAERTHRAETGPVVTTAVAVSLGFLVLTASSFKPIIYFGGLTALLMMVGMISDLVLTPLLLSSVRFVTLWDVVNLEVGKKVLQDCALFHGLTPRQIKKVILLSKVKEIPTGQAFMKQGDVGKEMFVILDGKVKVDKTAADGRHLHLGDFGQGDVIGEIALVHREKRTATVTTLEPTKLLVLEWKQLEQLAKAVPTISTRLFLNISRIICERLLKTHE